EDMARGPPVCQAKTMLSTTTSTSAIPASSPGRRYQPASSPLVEACSCAFGVSEYTSPASSASGFGRVARLTTTLTAMSTTNATPAPTKLAPCPGRSITPDSDIANTTTAAAVPSTRSDQPACGVIRFQNIPRMNVANNGALK